MRAAIAATFAAIVLTATLTGCASTTPIAFSSVTPAPATATVAPSPSPTTSPTTARPTADGSGLVAAQHNTCDFGAQIMRYLATGNNEGNPNLDQAFAQYVGVSAPQARSIADKAIQDCDASEYKAEAAQASASAAAAAKAAQAQADAQASASAAASKAALLAVELKTCAAIGGRLDTGWHRCDSAIRGNPTGNTGVNCDWSWVDFTADGQVDQSELDTQHQYYPGCFK